MSAQSDAHEWEYFKAAIDSLGVELDGEATKRERPDFLFTLKNGPSVGLEIVRAVDEYVARGRGVRKRLKARIVDALNADGLNVFVNFSIHENALALLAADKAALETELDGIIAIARDAATRGIASDGAMYEDSDEYDEERDETRTLRQFGVRCASYVSVASWDVPLAGWSTSGGGQAPNLVQEAIDDKSELLDAYRACGADEMWLLVVGSTGTGGALDAEHVSGQIFTSPFDRTYFLERFEGRCIEIAKGEENAGP